MPKRLPPEFRFIESADPCDAKAFSETLDRLNGILRERRKPSRGDQRDRTGHTKGNAALWEYFERWFAEVINRGIGAPAAMVETLALLSGRAAKRGVMRPRNPRTWLLAVGLYAAYEAIGVKPKSLLDIERKSDIDHSVLADYLKKPEFRLQVRMVAESLRPRLGRKFAWSQMAALKS